MARKPTDLVPTMLRMEESLRKKLERAAKKNRQSLNSEMVVRLALSLEPPASAAPARQRDELAAVLLGGDEAADLLQRLAFTLQPLRGEWPQGQTERRALAAQLIKQIFSELDPLSAMEPGPDGSNSPGMS